MRKKALLVLCSLLLLSIAVTAFTGCQKCKHEGGVATCNQKAICTLCGKFYGDFAEDNHVEGEGWKQTNTTHNRQYTCCGMPITDAQKHAWVNGVCTECEYVCAHSGGLATFFEKAICEYCGEEYGELADDYTGGRHIREKGTTNYQFIANGKTDYFAILPSVAGDDVLDAYTEFETLMRESTNILFTKKIDAEVTAPNKFISFGWTKQLEDAVLRGEIVVPEDLRGNGFVIKTVGENIYIVGGGDAGTLFGAYQFAYLMFDYIQYTTEIYHINQNVTNLKLPDLHYVEDPDIGERLANWGAYYYKEQEAHRLGYRLQYDEVLVSDYHTALNFLKPSVYYKTYPEWYEANQKQLCYTAHGNRESYEKMVETMALVMWQMLQNESQKNNITLTQAASDFWCNCTDSNTSDDLHACASTIADYNGACTSTQLFFVNDVCEKIESYRAQFQPNRAPIIIHIFAYQKTIPAPVESEKVDGKWVPADGSRGKAVGHQNLSVLMAINGTQNYQEEMDDATNAKTFDLISQYRAVANHVSTWAYCTYFDNFFVPYDSFEVNQEHYKYYAAAGSEMIFNQGQQNNGAASCFSNLKAYLCGRWGWDVNLDYDTLVDAYFENVFGKKDGAMRTFYNEMRQYMHDNNLNQKVDLYASGVGKSLFDSTLLLKWIGYCDQALEEIEHLKQTNNALWKKMHKAITLESLMPRYFIAKYHTSLMSGMQVTEYRNAFLIDCQYVGLTMEDMSNQIVNSIKKW